MPFNSDINNPDILENFDFERFLQTPDGGSNFDPSPFEAGDGIEIGDGPNIREPLKLEQSLRNIDPSQPESVEHVVIQPKAKPEGSIAGIEGLHVVEKGIVEDQERTDPKESDAYSSKHVQDHYHDANTVNPELLNHVQTHMTQSPDLARQGHWDPKKIIKGRQLYLKRPANRRDDQSTSTPDSPKFKRPTIPKMSPVSEKEVKETHHEKKVESMKGEYNKSTPSDSRVAVDEADLKKQAKASLMGSDDWNMSPSLGGMDLPAEPMDRPLEKKPLLPAKDIKSSRKELTGLPNQADLPATDSRPQLPPIQGLGLAIDIMPPQKDDSSVKGFRNRHGKKIDTAKEPVAVPEEVRSAQEDAAISGFRQRRTLRRVAACTTCRHEKVKCDRTRPQCVHCEQFGIECVYDDGKSLDQDAGSDVSSHTEKDLERPSQVPSRANSKRDSEQSTGDGAALALYWQIAPATSAAPMFSRHFRRNPGLLDSAAEANKEDPLPSPQIGKGLLSHRLADNYGRHKTGMPVSIPTPLPIHSAQKPFRPTFNRTDPATSRNFEQRLFACQMCGEYFARLFDLRRHVALRKEKESHAGEHDPGSVVDSNIKPGPDPDLSSHLDESLGAPSVMDASSPTHPPGTLSPSPSAFAKAKPRGTVRAADPATSIQDQHTDFGLVDSVSERERVEPWQHESEQGESRLADMEVADRLVLLWTTVKPL